MFFNGEESVVEGAEYMRSCWGCGQDVSWVKTNLAVGKLMLLSKSNVSKTEEC